jgi:hypothetical protein
MKRILLALIILIFCVTAFSGCTPKEFKNLNENEIKSITVTTLPEFYGYECRLIGDEAHEVVDYLSNLNLSPVLFEVRKGGLTWVISIEYENENTTDVKFFDKKVSVNGTRYRMENEEAEIFEGWLVTLTQSND